MKRRLLLVLAFAEMMLAGTAVVAAQTTAGPVEVRESSARAILAGDSIHLQLPFAAPATRAGRAAVWTLSPTGAKSAETAVEFAAGARGVSASLPWPKDEKGKKADEIGWYRIGYRIGTNAGVLSIGAIAPNLLTLRLALESENYDDAQNEYEAGIKEQLEPVGDAILAARPAQRPATLDGVRAIADAAGLDPALLLDPWETPYKVHVSRDWNAVNLSVLSAGPDKRFGTDDDFSVNVVQRNVFALPGERLSKILQDRVTSGEPLPGTVDELKRMARRAIRRRSNI